MKRFLQILAAVVLLNTAVTAQNINIITDSVIFLPIVNNDYNKLILKKSELDKAKIVQCKLGKILSFEVTFSTGGSIVIKEFKGDRIGRDIILLLGKQPDGTKVYFDLVIETDKGQVKKSMKTYLNTP